MTEFNCHPVFLGEELKNNYYKSERAVSDGAFENCSHGCIILRAASAAHSRHPPAFLLPLPHCPPPAAEFCKQQLWPILHYLIPLSPTSLGRFDPNLWSAYVRANMAFANKLVEVLGSLEDDFVWIHDYHLLVLPSLLRKRFHRIK